MINYANNFDGFSIFFFWLELSFLGWKILEIGSKMASESTQYFKTQQFKIQNSVLRKLQAINNSDKTDLNRISSKRT
jgi:hypothetical protein